MTSSAPVLRVSMKGGFAAGLFCLFCQPVVADAQVVSVCDVADQMGKIATPEDLNIRHYANGNVMIAVVDDGRVDAAQALSLLVVSPPLNSQGQRQCRLVSASFTTGYAALVLDRAEAAYDPAVGLTVSFPAVVMPSDDSLGDKIDLAVTINQATGMISPTQIATAE